MKRNPMTQLLDLKGVPLNKLTKSAFQVMKNIRSHLSQQLSNEGLTADQKKKYTGVVMCCVGSAQKQGDYSNR